MDGSRAWPAACSSGWSRAPAPGDFPAAESLRVISIVVIGGLSSVTGAVLGAFCVVGLPKLFNDSVEIGLLTSGAGMLILLLYFPGGLVQVLYSVRDAAVRVPRPPRARSPEPVVERAAPADARSASRRREIPRRSRRGDPGRRALGVASGRAVV